MKTRNDLDHANSQPNENELERDDMDIKNPKYRYLWKTTLYQPFIDGIEEVYKNANKSERDFIDSNWKDLCEQLINEFEQKINK